MCSLSLLPIIVLYIDGADYTGGSITRLVQPGETRFCTPVPIINDIVLNEPDEAFRTTCLVMDTPFGPSGDVIIFDVSPPSE